MHEAKLISILVHFILLCGPFGGIAELYAQIQKRLTDDVLECMEGSEKSTQRTTWK
jgi:hypothetical protein